MPISPEFTAHVVEQLNAARPIRHRKMFGGLGFYFNEIFFAVGDNDRLFFKTDSQNAEDYTMRGMEPWVPDGTPSTHYHEVPAEILENPEALGEWIEKSAAAAVRLKKKK